jgi:predicted PolB exonuclease-like 3'-5' exonuclease
MSERTIFLDIETIPTQSPDVIAAIGAQIKPPANMKKPETIAAWEATDKAQAVADAVAKTSFDPARGHICAIAWAVDDGGIVSSHIDDVQNEALMLREFFAAVSSFHRTTWVGHYISGFDLRFILCRAVVLGVTIPRCIPRNPKPWDATVFDTMTAWAGARDTISMDNLCAALGIPGKGEGLDGSKVAQAWAEGQHKEIAQYCRDDVDRTRAIWRKFQAVGW